MKVFNAIAVFTAVILFSSCSSITVVTDYDKTVDFTKYKTYNIKSPRMAGDGTIDPEKLSKRNIEAIHSNIELQMNQKGYVKSANPDVWIIFYIKIDTKQELRTTSTGYYAGNPYYYGGYYGYNTGFSDVSVVEYTEGSIIIDLVDSKDDVLVWQGVGKKTINENKIDHTDEIRKTIGEIFYRYRFSPAK
ncbi:MAG: DUF4136 domain-containing protein [Flavobacteriales bacterium]|nr:DUF4136 domain-containing protein [Flavobacteriales bacterium]